MTQARNWCFTINNPTAFLDSLAVEDDVLYAVWQLESGQNGTEHFQGYIMFTRPLRQAQVLALFTDHPHLEVARGTPQQNRDYCTKNEMRIGEFSEIGIFPEKGQGKRSDLERLQIALDTGLAQHEYAKQFFTLFARYPNLRANYLSSLVPPREGDCDVTATLYIGAPGTGKSRLAFRHAIRRGTVYRKFPGKWWDGYIGQRGVIFDDFRGSSMSFTDFKLTVDRYPLRVEVKGSTCEMGSSEFYITSNFRPEEWWSTEVTGTDHSAIIRRLGQVYFFPRRDHYILYPDYGSFLFYQASGALAPNLPPSPYQEVEIAWDAED